MKFHVLKDHKGNPVDFIVHVHPPEQKAKYTYSCDCAFVYRVDMATVGKDALAAGVPPGIGPRFICRCMGEPLP